MTFRASLLPTLFCLLHTLGNSAGAQSPQADTQLLLEMADGACRYSGIFVPRSARLLEITDLNPFFDAPGPPQKVLKTSTGLLLLPDGTGRVYVAQPTDGRLDFVRIDSTRFMGYNFGAFPFVYRDTLYSYGGYGFWHYNGQLRVFDTKKHEWQLVPLDREVPIQVADPLGISCWLDETTGHLYVNGMSPHQPNTDSLHVLDLNQDSWTTLGKSEIPNAQVIFQVATPWGVFCKMAWN
ncbi:MAG: hypothetical protein JNN04_04335, partial [Cyclobacteriaceae bacterium]|nr:hypothetical protein [Cyclobacteriaceae bacterium]